MITKKICMLGAFAVGKTSLVKRFVESIFGEQYKTTIGVQISKKVVMIENEEIQLMVWDIEGVDEFIEMKTRYLKGAAGCMLVVDGTRPKTAKIAEELFDFMTKEIGDCPFSLLLNKHDLSEQWQIDDLQIKTWHDRGWQPTCTSAKTGENVERVFEQLAQQIYKHD